MKTKLGLVHLYYSVDNYSVQSVVKQWEVRKDDVISGQKAVKAPPPMTWRSLLHILSQGMNLKELSQRIEDYFQHSGELYLQLYL